MAPAKGTKLAQQSQNSHFLQRTFDGSFSPSASDTFSRFLPVLDPRLSYRGEDVVETLDRVCSTIGYPATIRVDQGSEFVSRDLDIWAYARGVTLDFSRPGKPTDNAFTEAFNSRVRAERMNAHWFLTLCMDRLLIASEHVRG